MLELRLGRIIKKALDEHYAPHRSPLSLDQVLRMRPIPSTKGVGYTILAGQYGDLTILVWTQVDEDENVVVRGVKTQAW